MDVARALRLGPRAAGAALVAGAFFCSTALGAEPFEPAVQAVGARPKEGLSLGATLEAGLLERDLWAGGSLALGYEHDLVGLRLRAPIYLRVFDLPPKTPRGAGPCALVRCEALGLHEEGFELEGLSRIVEHLRLGQPGDALYARGGPLFVTLGQGRLIERYLNSPDPDRFVSGLYARARLPLLGASFEGVVGNLFAPQRLFGARAALRPLRFGAFLNDQDVWARLLGRLAVGLEAAADLTLPAAPGGARDPPERPLVGGALDVTWPLFDEGGLVQLAPFVAGGLLYGLSKDGGLSAEMGAGASAGATLELRLPFVGLRVDGAVGLDAPAHRAGIFGLLYGVERRTAVAGGVAAGGGLSRVPAPGGAGFSAGGELVLLDALSVGARYRKDAAPGSGTLESSLEAAHGSARLSARGIRRGVDAPRDAFGWDPRTLLVIEASWGVFGPLSAFVRYVRMPRFVSGTLRTDDDVLVGVSGDLVIAPEAP